MQANHSNMIIVSLVAAVIILAATVIAITKYNIDLSRSFAGYMTSTRTTR